MTVRLFSVPDSAIAAGLVGQVEPTERNPRGIAIHHSAGAVHADCAPNVLAECAWCGRTLVVCTATRDELDAMKAESWICGDCRLAETGDAS